MTAQILSRPKVLLPGEGSAYRMLTHIFTEKVTAAETNGDWIMVEVTDKEGAGAPLHTHPWYEVFYILDGELEVQVGNRKLRATAGSSLYVPENCAHDFTIVSPTVRFLVMMPAYAEGFYREVSEKVTSFPPNPEIFQELFDKYDMQLLEEPSV